MNQDEPTTEAPDEPFALDARPDILDYLEAAVLAAALADTKVWR